MQSDRHIHIVAITSAARAEQARLCFSLGYHAEIYSNCEDLLAVAPSRGIALVEDIPERGGIGRLIERMGVHGFWLPVLATAVDPRPCRVVEAVRAGALDYLSLPLDQAELAEALHHTEAEVVAIGHVQRRAIEARARLASLTVREREVLDLVASGSSNKMIGRELNISPRTVEIHRANMMAKLCANHAADAVRLRLEAAAGMPGLPVPLTAQIAA